MAPIFYSDVLTALASAGVEGPSLAAAAAVLERLGLRCRLPVGPDDLAQPDVVRGWIEDRNLMALTFVDPAEPLREVDLVIASPVPYEEIERDADRVKSGSLEFKVASIDVLVRMKRGFAHHHTDEELRVYAALTPEQKLRWLDEAWRFTAEFLPAGRREAWMKMRRGEI